jgi:hypothetical protein
MLLDRISFDLGNIHILFRNGCYTMRRVGQFVPPRVFGISRAADKVPGFHRYEWKRRGFITAISTGFASIFFIFCFFSVSFHLSIFLVLHIA